LPAKLEIDVKTILDNSPDIIFTIDPQGKILYANPSFYNLLGYSKQEVIGKSIKQFIADKEIYKTCMLSVKQYGACLNQDTYFVKKDGSIIHVVKNVRAVEKDNKIQYLVVNARDITILDHLNSLLEEAKEKLRKQNKQLEELVKEKTKDLEFRKILLEKIKDSLPVGMVFISKDGSNIILNSLSKKYLKANKLKGIKSLLLHISKNIKKGDRSTFLHQIRDIFLNKNCEGDFELKLKNNKYLRLVVKPVGTKKDFYGYLVIFNDITNQKKIEKELKDKLYKDQLTNLYNRLKLVEDLEELVNPTIAIVNIDDFKEINDFYGHEIGDFVLQEFGKFLNNFCKKYRFSVYKLSGDEFAVLSKRFYPRHDFETFIQLLISTVEKKVFQIGDYEVHLNITIGVCDEKENILSKADMALKQAKEKKKPYLFFDKSLDLSKRYAKNISIVKELKRAIENDNVVVYYQPIINNSTGIIEEYECLVRLIDSRGNILLPSKFLDIAIKSKLYPKITKIVVQQAFNKFKNKDVRFAINLSISDIQNHETVSFILDALKNYKNRDKVVFEILESEGIENFENIYRFIKEIRSLGAKVAIDDFGSGYSNFEFILKLEVDYLKIDSSIIKNLDTDIYSNIIAETIVNFCKKLGIKTIAEFVYSESVYEVVKSLGIDYSQGFFIGEPSPFLKDERRKEIVKN